MSKAQGIALKNAWQRLTPKEKEERIKKISEGMKASWAKRSDEERKKISKNSSKARKRVVAQQKALSNANPYKKETTIRSSVPPKINKVIEQSVSMVIEEYNEAAKTMSYTSFLEFRPTLIHRIIKIIKEN